VIQTLLPVLDDALIRFEDVIKSESKKAS